VNRGDVFWFTYAPPDKRRPVVVLTRTTILATLERVTVAPLTRNIRGIPSEVVVDVADGIPERSAVNLDNISTVPRAQLRVQVASLSRERLREIEGAIAFALGFDED
jgi:mRNA interferase MazF